VELDLLDARVIATLATVGGEGLPYLSAVWFTRDGGDLLIATGGKTQKALNASVRPQAAVLVHGRGERPLHGLAASGTIAVIRGTDAAALNERVWRKYLTSAGRVHPDVGEAIAGHDDVTLRFTPGEWRAWSTAVDFGGAFELPGVVQPLDPTER
jgi:hypothetical protein